MDFVEIKNENLDESMGLHEISAEPQVCALSDQYRGRGVVGSVRQAAREQIKKEEATRALAPNAYRMSGLSDAAICGIYRKGKHYMAASDLLLYFSETRQKRISQVDFSQPCDLGTELIREEGEETRLCPAKPTRAQRMLQAVQKGTRGFQTALPTWFDAAAPDTKDTKKTFPFSAFAAILAIAVSLMLIVASSVLLTRAENRVSQLNSELLTAYDEMTELQSDLDVRDDLLVIRRIAVEEYGMVGEEYVRMQYISLQQEDSIEAYEEERASTVELSALLSAMGIKK
ncbi:MAG: hypothetical protein IJX28_02930 [Clostridia bacterium]|nr:hypothetical protein [Clostridia bacterium]